jgi:hypothetical protein
MSADRDIENALVTFITFELVSFEIDADVKREDDYSQDLNAPVVLVKCEPPRRDSGTGDAWWLAADVSVITYCEDDKDQTKNEEIYDVVFRLLVDLLTPAELATESGVDVCAILPNQDEMEKGKSKNNYYVKNIKLSLPYTR